MSFLKAITNYFKVKDVGGFESLQKRITDKKEYLEKLLSCFNGLDNSLKTFSQNILNSQRNLNNITLCSEEKFIHETAKSIYQKVFKDTEENISLITKIMSKSVSSRRSFIKKKQKEKGDKSNEEIKVSNFRGSPKVLKISKSNYYYLINREKYDITKIMMMIDYGRLSTLGHRFRKYPEGIDKIEFVALLANVLKEDKMPVYELTDLIYGIYKFFR